MATQRNFVVVGSARALVVQVLLAIRTFTDARCIVICGRRNRFLRYSTLSSTHVEIDFGGADDDRFIDTVNRLHDAHPGLMLLTADCDGTRIVNRVRQQLKAQVAPIPDAPTLECFDNKWTFYQFCVMQGLNVPATRYASSKIDLDFSVAARELGIPFIIKPLDQQGSKGVLVVGSADAYRRLVVENKDYQYQPLIAQRYIRGTDIGVNVLAVDGKIQAIAIQQRQAPQDEGAPIDFIANEALGASARRIALTSGYTGVMNIDARIEENSGEVFLFESNPRFWRSLSASVWCGLNFVAEMVEPRSAENGLAELKSGKSDTFYHPIFRPRAFARALFDRGHQGRLARLMMFEICTLGSSVMALARRTAARRAALARALPARPIPRQETDKGRIECTKRYGK